MRPTGRPQSTLRYPLNHILGPEASVRVLRVVMLSDIPIGVSELARLTLLQASGVARVCTRLEDLGVLEAVGRGSRNRQYRVAPRFPFSAALRNVFSEERARADRILTDVRSAVGSSAQIRAAWVEGPVALGIDGPGDALIVGALAEPTDVNAVRLDLWRSLLAIQQGSDVTAELRVVTLADLKTSNRQRLAELEHVLPLRGPPPLDLLSADAPAPPSRPGVRAKRHDILDARAKAIARAIADRLRRDPSLVEDARRYIERRLPSASPGEGLELQEWLGILSTMSVPRLRRFLVQDDSRATRLRQSLPFLNALSDAERRAIFAAAVETK